MNGNVNGNVNVNGKGIVNGNGNVNGNVNVNDTGETWLVTHCDSDDTVWSENHDGKAWSGTHRYINILSETKQRDKPCSQCGCGFGGGNNVGVRTSGLGSPSNLLIDVNDSLQSWIKDRNIIVNSTFPVTFRCIISGPSECGKTVLLKYLFLNNIKFDRLYIIGPTGNQSNDLEYKDIVLIKNIKEFLQ